MERTTSRTGEGNESQPVHTADDRETAAPTRFTSSGAIPAVLGFPGTSAAPSASDRAFKLPLTTPDDLRIAAERLEVERLLKSKTVTSGHDAIAALEILLQAPDADRTRMIDQLDDRAFEQLIERLTDDQRVRFAALVDSSQDPKRKVLLWAAQHKARARTDLRRYEGDFGDAETGDQTDEQAAAQGRHDRRKTGVEATDAEVARECAALLAKGEKLKVEDVDAMRARKDKELDVETEHNVNLTAETAPREDGSQVAWSTGELDQVDAALDKLPDRHVHDANSVGTFNRRANRHFMDTKGGEYHGSHIDIYDRASEPPPGREQVDPVEYTMTHEIGHEVESENKGAFKKFQKAAGWTTTTEDEVRDRGATDDQVSGMRRPTQVGDKVYTRGDKGVIHQVDETAIPSAEETGTKRWDYAPKNAQEHFAELYAMAVQTPEQLYTDYVVTPAANTRAAQDSLAEKRRALKQAPSGAARDAQVAAIKRGEQQLARAQKLQQQRAELFSVIRNDVFGAEKRTQAAVGRLRQHGLDADAIRTFEQRAARISTPAQLADLEREAMR